MENITLQCSQCNETIDTTYDNFIQQQKTRGDKCPLCNHGDVYIIWGEYSELALTIHRAAQELKKIDPTTAARLAQPITEVIGKLDTALPCGCQESDLVMEVETGKFHCLAHGAFYHG
jgi:hypothetical protein